MAGGLKKYIITGHIIEVYEFKNYCCGKGGNTGSKFIKIINIGILIVKVIGLIKKPNKLKLPNIISKNEEILLVNSSGKGGKFIQLKQTCKRPIIIFNNDSKIIVSSPR